MEIRQSHLAKHFNILPAPTYAISCSFRRVCTRHTMAHGQHNKKKFFFFFFKIEVLLIRTYIDLGKGQKDAHATCIDSSAAAPVARYKNQHINTGRTPSYNTVQFIELHSNFDIVPYFNSSHLYNIRGRENNSEKIHLASRGHTQTHSTDFYRIPVVAHLWYGRDDWIGGITLLTRSTAVMESGTTAHQINGCNGDRRKGILTKQH